MSDDNRWIVSSHDFKEHRSPILAENERRRLAELFPKLTFRVYRIKRVTNPSDRRCAHGKLFTESCTECGYIHPRDRVQSEPDHGATDGE